MKKIFLFMLLLSFCVFSSSNNQKDLLTSKMKEFKIKQESITYFFEAVALGKLTNKYEEIMLKSVKADQKNYFALDNLGIYYRTVKNDPDKAIEYYRKSIAVNPNNAFPYTNMGAAYLYKKDLDSAEKVYTSLAKSIPDYPEGYYGQAQVFILKGEYSKALTAVKQAKNKYQNLDSKKYFEEAESKELHLIDCEFLIGYINYLSGNYQEAVDTFINVYPVLRLKKPELIRDFIQMAVESNKNIKKTNIKIYEENNKKLKEVTGIDFSSI